MCYYVQQMSTVSAVEKRFKAKVVNSDMFLFSEMVNGFGNDNIPVILDSSPQIITTDYHWGLVPSWSANTDVRKSTLNARIESAEAKPTFAESVQNRCLVIATAFFEWRWLDEKGSKKEKHIIHSAVDDILCFAGIYSTWRNKDNGNVLNTYSIMTTAANPAMEYVHNTKKRMPVVINKADESAWLDAANPISEFSFPAYQPNIIAFPV